MSQDNPYSAPDLDPIAEAHVPLTINGTLRVALGIYSEHFWAIAAVVLVLWLPVELFTSFLAYEVLPEEYFALGLLSNSIAEILVGTLASGTVSFLAFGSLRSEPITFAQAAWKTLVFWPLLILNHAIFELVITAGCLALVIPGLYAVIRMSLVEPVTLFEKRVGFGAIGRSYELTSKHFGFVVSMVGLCMVAGVAFYLSVNVPTWYFPELDSWYYDGFTSVGYDFLSAGFTICFVVMWSDLRHNFDATKLNLPVPMQ
jgi:hypothetical protein